MPTSDMKTRIDRIRTILMAIPLHDMPETFNPNCLEIISDFLTEIETLLTYDDATVKKAVETVGKFTMRGKKGRQFRSILIHQTEIETILTAINMLVAENGRLEQLLNHTMATLKYAQEKEPA